MTDSKWYQMAWSVKIALCFSISFLLFLETFIVLFSATFEKDKLSKLKKNERKEEKKEDSDCIGWTEKEEGVEVEFVT